MAGRNKVMCADNICCSHICSGECCYIQGAQAPMLDTHRFTSKLQTICNSRMAGRSECIADCGSCDRYFCPVVATRVFILKL